MRQGALAGFMCSLLLFAACQPAGRYPSAKIPRKEADDETKERFPREWAWMKPTPAAFDVPIVFVADSNPEWHKLPAFWNHFPPPPAGRTTCHLGQTPLGAAAAMVLAGHGSAVKIKVPRGLPDPTSNIPVANPPTLAAWQLGKSLFYDRLLVVSQFKTLSCADCHDPKHGFCENQALTEYGSINTPSLINCVYNKHQFWDGRVTFLEQVVTRELNDEKVAGERRAQDHIWSGLVPRLRDDPRYRERFKIVFGVPPTQDNIAKALATFMRTILSGNSVYDRAQAARGKDKVLTAKQFETALTRADLDSLGKGKKAETAEKLAKGHDLFHGKARCQACHFGPLFADHDFHNIGVEDIDPIFETGRLAQVPLGMKENRLRGAYKTPTLRNLSRTEPYTHTGMFSTLEKVVDFFDRGINWQDSLATQLLQGPREAQRLNLSKEEIGDLVLFLRAMDGDAVDPILLAPSKK
jgi:cytochrome c peroxidase